LPSEWALAFAGGDAKNTIKFENYSLRMIQGFWSSFGPWYSLSIHQKRETNRKCLPFTISQSIFTSQSRHDMKFLIQNSLTNPYCLSWNLCALSGKITFKPPLMFHLVVNILVVELISVSVISGSCHHAIIIISWSFPEHMLQNMDLKTVTIELKADPSLG